MFQTSDTVKNDVETPWKGRGAVRMAMRHLNLAEEFVGDLLWDGFETWSEWDAGLDTTGQFEVNQQGKSQREKIAYFSVDGCSQPSTQPPRAPRARRLVHGLTVNVMFGKYGQATNVPSEAFAEV